MTISSKNDEQRNFTTPIDGIAMSPDFQYVYYCALADRNLYRIPTEVLRGRGNFSQFYQHVGMSIIISYLPLYMYTRGRELPFAF